MPLKPPKRKHLKPRNEIKRTRSFMASNVEYAALVQEQLPYKTEEGKTIYSGSELILYALRRLPRKK